MNADLIMTIAMLKQLKLLTAKQAKTIYEELKYKNLSMSLEDCIKLVESSFKAARVGELPTTTDFTVGGKTIKVTK